MISENEAVLPFIKNTATSLAFIFGGVWTFYSSEFSKKIKIRY
jgi:hypothetical protein